MNFRFDLVHKDCSSEARAGVITTDHGVIETPIFMPIATQGTVKAVPQRVLEEIGTQIVLSNTYHLYLRPGVDVIARAGGLHKFIGWNKPMLTDSGGFQFFRLADLNKISEQGVVFQSHLDGSHHSLTPEGVIQIERKIGADIMMVLDECVAYPSDFGYASEASERTLRWAKRCKNEFEKTHSTYEYSQALFGIVQGSVYPGIRERSANELVNMSFEGYAIGGLAVGEPVQVMYEIMRVCNEILPTDKARYLMGVGTPENLLESIGLGIDMFDCVLPTRNGRNAMAFAKTGRKSIKSAIFKEDFRPIDESCACYTCRNFSRAYLRHMFQVHEILPMELVSLHNLYFYSSLLRDARDAIVRDGYSRWKANILEGLKSENSI